MELCNETLADYIERGLGSVEDEHYFSPEQLLERFQIAEEIASALFSVHKEHNLIHRDLKPSNIFFTFDKKIKLGDFGLATKVLADNVEIQTSPFSFSRKVSTVSRYRSNGKNNEADEGSINSKNSDFCLTKKVGTPGYAAPEQINGGEYDQKADIFSLGLILFELFCPFGSRMEKKLLVENLRLNGEVPELLMRFNAKIGEMLKGMCCLEKENRPDIKEVKTTVAKVKQKECKIVLRTSVMSLVCGVDESDFIPIKIYNRKWINAWTCKQIFEVKRMQVVVLYFHFEESFYRV